MIKIKKDDGQTVIIAKNSLIAKSFFDRLFGLTIKKFNENFDGIVFLDCNSIHSCFMLYKFDLIFVDKSGKVVKLYKGVKPFRLCFGTKDTKLIAIELPKNTINRYKLEIGNVLQIER